MAVQARFLSHAFPHDLNAFRPMECGSTQFLEDCAPAIGNNNTVLSDLPRSELTCTDNYGFAPRKRARMATQGPADLAHLARHRMVLQQASAMHGLVLPCDAESRAVGSGAPSTSGRVANAAGLNSLLYNQGVEMDALIRLEVCACSRLMVTIRFGCIEPHLTRLYFSTEREDACGAR
jgi:E3 ubiquitin-protein ligase BOI-like protein